MSDEKYSEYVEKNIEFRDFLNDIPYEFVEKFIDNMIENLGIFKNK